ncbi:hypothetical protein HYPGJ_20276 [Hyphomicrobium sp. GJ21]|nr:hypothetical protein HYPGJ_20276 [Hyphomicrobium sp. GJ21]
MVCDLDRAVSAPRLQGHDTRVSNLHGLTFKAFANDVDFIGARPDNKPGSGTIYLPRQCAAFANGG